MSLLDALSRKVADAGQKTVQKTREVSDLAKLNSLISQEKDQVNQLYYQLGKKYMELYEDNPEEEFVSLIQGIRKGELQIESYQKEVQEIKGVQYCNHCGGEVPIRYSYCSFCGNSIKKPTQETLSADYVTCPQCHHSVKKEMRFCTSCGHPMTKEEPSLSEKKICSNCQSPQDPDASFCADCGEKLS